MHFKGRPTLVATIFLGNIRPREQMWPAVSSSKKPSPVRLHSSIMHFRHGSLLAKHLCVCVSLLVGYVHNARFFKMNFKFETMLKKITRDKKPNSMRLAHKAGIRTVPCPKEAILIT